MTKAYLEPYEVARLEKATTNLRDRLLIRVLFHLGCRMLQEWLGHANIGSTMRYRKVAGRELKEWYQRLWGEKGKTSG